MTDGLPDDALLATADTVAVHGLGREGRSAIRDLADCNPAARVVVLDDREPNADELAELADRGVEVAIGEAAAAEAVAGVDVVVRSAGVPHTHPGQRAAWVAEIPVTTVLNVFLARHRPDNVVAITGTKGKSTTAKLVGHLLAATGRQVEVAGNVGVSVLDLDVAPSDLDHLVLELSSYQLSDLRGHVAVGAWLNLHADHHGWHGGRGAYAADKARIVALSDLLVANRADRRVMSASGDHDHRVVFDATVDPVVMGAARRPETVLGDTLASSRLVGEHNLANLAAALTIGHVLDVDLEAMLAGVADFTPLPHRLELVHDDGRRWVDDSISTIPEAAVAALAAFPDVPITLLAGGFERGQDHAPLVAAVAARTVGAAPVNVVAMPDTGMRLADDLTDHDLDVTRADDLAEAVAHADAVTPQGGVVLLSPAAASFHAFESYADRGEEFARLAAGTDPRGVLT